MTTRGKMQLPQPAIGHLLKHLPQLQKAFGTWPTYFLVLVAVAWPLGALAVAAFQLMH